MTIVEAFAKLPDPRREHPNKLHKLIDIVVIALCAVIAKCESWEEIADYGEEKESFFKGFLSLENGIPSHDTFNRVFARLDPVAWQSCFMSWMLDVSHLSQTKLIALDGKVLRATKASGTGKREVKQTALAMATAWASENELILGQLAFEKGHEPQALLELLCLLELEGASISMDAAGCYPEIARYISEQDADYVLSLKANQGKLYEDANWLFEQQLEHNTQLESFETFDVAHGREETRKCWVITELDYLQAETWANLNTLIIIESNVLRQGKLSSKRRFFLSSHSYNPEQALARVREHWSIENQQHYSLDVLFHEDSSRTRSGFAAQNFAALRRLALNLINLDTNSKLSKRRKRLKALLNDDYLLELLGFTGLA
jgi:predicted transposase YbfD/YdcC